MRSSVESPPEVPATASRDGSCDYLGEPVTPTELVAAVTRQISIQREHPGIVESLSEGDRRQVAHAARNNQSAVVRLMLECGWPVEARGQHHATPLHWAAFHGNAEMAATILRFNPPLEATDADFSGTPLGWAIHGSEHGWHCRTGDYGATVATLIRAGARRPDVIEGSAVVRDVLRGSAPASS